MSFNREVGHAQQLSFTELYGHGAVVQTLAGNITVGKDAPSVHVLDPNSVNRVVTMPAEADVEGKVWLFKNLQAVTNTIELQNDAAGTICTIAATGAAIVGVFGGTWRVFLNGAAA